MKKEKKKQVKNLQVMSVDLETDLGADLEIVFNDILPRILDEFDSRGIKATFFVVSDLLKNYSKEIKEIARRGHEVASHSRTHSFLNFDNSWEEINSSRLDFLDVGIDVSGFRAPGYVTVSDHKHLAMVKRAGYSYDASFAAYLPGRYFRPLIGRRPYVAHGDELKKSESKKLIEMPMPTHIWPSGLNGLSYFKLFYPVSFWIARLFGMRYMFYLHLWEFIDVSRLKPNGIFEKLIACGCGDKAWKIFMKYLDLAEKQSVKFVSCKEYLNSKGLS